MKSGMLGKVYQAGEIILRRGEAADCMYVIQEGRVEVLSEHNGCEIPLAILEETDFFGEMALFERDVRAATVRALGPVRVLTLDKRTFLRRIQEDPSLAFRILEKLCQRIRELNEEVTLLRGQSKYHGGMTRRPEAPTA
jgi:CRP-like cAMP-binding protein